MQIALCLDMPHQQVIGQTRNQVVRILPAALLLHDKNLFIKFCITLGQHSRCFDRARIITGRRRTKGGLFLGRLGVGYRQRQCNGTQCGNENGAPKCRYGTRQACL